MRSVLRVRNRGLYLVFLHSITIYVYGISGLKIGQRPHVPSILRGGTPAAECPGGRVVWHESISIDRGSGGE